MDAHDVEVLAEQILLELKKVNENLTALCFAIRSNPNRQPTVDGNRHSIDSSGRTLESRTALAMEQLRRRQPPGPYEQMEPVRLPSTAQSSGQSSSHTWGLEIGQADLVLDTHNNG